MEAMVSQAAPGGSMAKEYRGKEEEERESKDREREKTGRGP